MVRDEVEALKEDDPVYKMHGKVLILQDMSEARSTVAARLRLIQGELTKVEKAITGVEGTRTAVINKLQGGGQAQQEDS
jgi:chaperonin cofactor prefoldin